LGATAVADTTVSSPRCLLQPPPAEGLSPPQALAEAEGYLSAHEVDAPRRTAEILLMHALRTDRSGLYVRREAVRSEEAVLLAKALSDRARGVPLQYVVGQQQFMDLILEMRPGVFVPRLETERLVEVALGVLREGPAEPTVVDVGTGTGAVALSIKRLFPTASVFATDVSTAAVELARANADRLGLDIEVLHGDLLEPVPTHFRGEVDLLVSNPPYVRPEEYDALPGEVKAEPYEALVGGVESHGRLVEAAVDWLAPAGWLITEIGADQADEVRRLFADRLTSVEVITDLANRNRVVRGSLKKLP
jgi:release factor glutamine methyltransferase